MKEVDFINVNIVVVILFYGFERCYHWGEMGKDYIISLLFILLFLTTACESIIISIKFLIKK